MTAKKGGISKTTAIIIVAIVVIAGVAGVAYYMIATAPPPKDYITIGCVQSLTGGLSSQTFVFGMYNRWIIDDYNKTGGLYVPEYGKKLPIKYIEKDDESDITKMLSLTEELITVDHVDLMFAPISTAFNFAAFPTYQKYHMPVVALAFGSDKAAEKMRSGEYSYCFSVLGMPSEAADQVLSLFQYINTTKAPGELNNVAILYHSDQHGVEYSSAIYTALSLAGFTISVDQSYLPTGVPMDFSTLITNYLIPANPDVVMICGYEGLDFILSCMTAHYNPKLLVAGPSAETPFLVYDVYHLTAAQVNGTMLYDGWPAAAYKTGDLKTWADNHFNRTLDYGPFPWYPFPASATFYAGLDCLFKAVEKVGLDHAKIRNSLANDNFTTLVGNTHLHQGYSMECSLAGTIAQWQGGNMAEIIWPSSAASSSIIYPKPSTW
jgi:branched-chain amino acid transport system substrate-binding protein